SPKLIWLNCMAEWRAPLSEWSTIPVRVGECGLNGEVGQIRTAGLTFYPITDAGLNIEPFLLSVENLSLKKVFELLQRPGLNRVLSQFGILSGEVQVESFNQMEFTGTLKDVEVAF